MFKFISRIIPSLLISSLLISSLLVTTTAWSNPLRPDPLTSTATKPTVTATPKKKLYRQPILSDILIIGDYKTAILNKKELRIFDTILGYTIIEINPLSVRLQRGTRKYLLELKVAGNLSIEPAQED